MRNKSIITLLLCLVFAQAIGQTTKKVPVFLTAQFSASVYSGYYRNNAMGPGFGVHTYLNTKSKIKPMLELTGDLMIDASTLYYERNEGLEGVDGEVINLFAGASYHPGDLVFLSLSAGPSIVSGEFLFGTKASFGLFFSKRQRWMMKFSFFNVFNQEPSTKKDFGAVSFGLGVRLF